MLSKITEKELTFYENWLHPRCQTETLFSNLDDLGEFSPTASADVRLYQYPFLDYSRLIDFKATAKHRGYSPKQEFALRKKASDLYNLGARKTGKSLFLKIDIATSLLYDDNLWGGFYSIDEKRIRGILDDVQKAFDYHPIFKEWNVQCKYKPDIRFYSKKNGWKVHGINMNLNGKTPGSNFYQLHLHKLFGDEISFETDAVYNIRKESSSENGCIFRFSGMTNFTRTSPIGRLYTDPKNKTAIATLPQFITPYWDEAEKADRAKFYSGQDSLDYRIYVKGEILEEGVSAIDMERVRKMCFQPKKHIKHFELTKKQFGYFKDIVVVERPKNADRIFISVDYGESSASEIAIFSEVKEQYNYLYNISLYNLTMKEQREVLLYLIHDTRANVVAIDCGDLGGRSLYREMEEIFPKDNLVWYDGSKKLDVYLEKDDKDEYIRKGGDFVYHQEYMSSWAFSRLVRLLYEGKLNLPIDFKLERQLSLVVLIKSGSRLIAKCTDQNDHLYDSFRIFALSQFLTTDFNKTKPMASKWGIGTF